MYKEEQVTRKRYFNMMEDMKGKIRVYCRVRPLLQFEKDKGQTFGLMLPDELTLAHMWKDEKKPREYNFDMVGTQSVAQPFRHFVGVHTKVHLWCCFVVLAGLQPCPEPGAGV